VHGRGTGGGTLFVLGRGVLTHLQLALAAGPEWNTQ
jgi:hypothetical protein